MIESRRLPRYNTFKQIRGSRTIDTVVRRLQKTGKEIKMESQFRKERKEQYKNRKIVGGVYRICCDAAGKSWLKAALDLQGANNRFSFFVATNACPEPAMAQAWKQYGATAFSFTILEKMEKKETQTPDEFAQDMEALFELWTEKEKMQGAQDETKR